MTGIADIAIIGGGAAGLSLAAAIAPHRVTILLESEDRPGFHATGRSAAVLVPSYGDALIRELTAMSRADLAPALRPRGMLRLARPDGIEAHEAMIAGQPGITRLTPEAALDHLPLLRPERFAAASIEADVHDIDVEALMQDWARTARRHGAAIISGARVEAIARDGDTWTLRAGGETPRARILVDAAGAWADAVAAMAGIAPLGLTARRRSVAVLPRPAALGDAEIPFTVTFPMRWFAKTDGASLLVSPGDEAAVAPHDAHADDMVLAEGLHRFGEDTGHTVTRLTRSWAGLRSFAPDEHPVLGFDPGAEGFFWLAGQGGSGIQTAPALARLAADALLGEALPAHLADALDPARITGREARQKTFPCG